MNNFGDSNARCPFFLRSEKATIYCEGIKDKTVTTILFRKETGSLLVCDRKEYMNKYCNCDYEKCRIYKMLMQKYE